MNACYSSHLPNYVTKRQQTQPIVKEISVLDAAGSERLIDCFDCTDWQVFVDSCETVDELNEHVTEYVKFSCGFSLRQALR